MRRTRPSTHVLFIYAAPQAAAASWNPPADVYRSADGWLVKVDLAGVRPTDVAVAAQPGKLVIRGSRRDLAQAAGYSLHRMEISYAAFERVVELPCRVDAGRIRTDYRDGMLLVYVHEEP
jgi:HSP20 family protein